MDIMWQFETAQFTVRAYIVEDADLDLSWDATGQITAYIECGRAMAFGAIVEVLKNSKVIGQSSLWGSVYEDPSEFFTDHRTSTYNGRNTLELKAQRRAICHYFPGMVAEAIADARQTLA